MFSVIHNENVEQKPIKIKHYLMRSRIFHGNKNQTNENKGNLNLCWYTKRVLLTSCFLCNIFMKGRLLNHIILCVCFKVTSKLGNLKSTKVTSKLIILMFHNLWKRGRKFVTVVSTSTVSIRIFAYEQSCSAIFIEHHLRLL